MMLREDQNTNRMKESLVVFKNTINNQYLNKIPVILFLNKIDLLRDKIGQVDIKQCFADFTGIYYNTIFLLTVYRRTKHGDCLGVFYQKICRF